MRNQSNRGECTVKVVDLELRVDDLIEQPSCFRRRLSHGQIDGWAEFAGRDVGGDVINHTHLRHFRNHFLADIARQLNGGIDDDVLFNGWCLGDLLRSGIGNRIRNLRDVGRRTKQGNRSGNECQAGNRHDCGHRGRATARMGDA